MDVKEFKRLMREPLSSLNFPYEGEEKKQFDIQYETKLNYIYNRFYSKTDLCSKNVEKISKVFLEGFVLGKQFSELEQLTEAKKKVKKEK